jgi:hypothetical protein
MHQISVLHWLDSTSKGLVSTVTDDCIHLRQGEMDGACGHYSMMMALIMLGLYRREDASDLLDFGHDSDTPQGKFGQRIKKRGFFEGTATKDIQKIIGDTFKSDLKVTSMEGTGVEIRNFVESNIKKDNPVMLAFQYKGGAHWVVVVGLDFCGEDDNKELYRFLVLDPGGSNPKFSLWNGVVSVKSEPGPYPYKWWTDNDNYNVKFIYALAFEKKEPA